MLLLFEFVFLLMFNNLKCWGLRVKSSIDMMVCYNQLSPVDIGVFSLG